MFDSKSTTILFLISLSFSLSAQKGTLSSGGDISSSGGSISYSIGQIDYHTLSSASNGTLFEGLQVPYEVIVVDGIENEFIQLECMLFPNPSTDKVFLSLTEVPKASLQFFLFDMNGRLLKQASVTEQLTEIPLESYSNSSYILKINMLDEHIKTFKIIKQ